MKRYLPLLIVLLLGLIIGFFLGQMHLEHQWSQPVVELRPHPASSGEGAAIAPGTRGLRPMPLRRSREALAQLSRSDSVQVQVGSVSRDDEQISLNIVLSNQGQCVISALQGLAYGFDAWGAPSAIRKDGSHVVAFESKDSLAPGATTRLSLPLAQAEHASIALARVETASCAR